MSLIRNPIGRNQHPTDEENKEKVSEALKGQSTSSKTLSALLKNLKLEHQIELSATGTVQGRPIKYKIFRAPKYPVSIPQRPQRRAGEGHDKLYKISFPVWALVDDATAMTLQAWVCPSNRLSKTVVSKFLCLVEKHGSMPRQVTTDCDAETVKLFAVMLRNYYHPHAL
ncbi:hypothetical protein R3P38DRAFT_2848683 [Favolaschia claudopus]|uniref:Uncharacterized protein n=1 Tax=Favolaschia claudopus TaxID=2862362 RepID=A0AAW0DWU1_9AGAR